MSVRLVNTFRQHFLKYVTSISQFKAKSLHYNSAQYSQASGDENSHETIKKEPPVEEKKGLTKENPVLVASQTDKCIVGCDCGTDEPTVKWFFLEEGSTQVCDCGYYFKLDKTDENTPIPEHARIMTVDDNMIDPRYGRAGMPFLPPKKMQSTASVRATNPKFSK